MVGGGAPAVDVSGHGESEGAAVVRWCSGASLCGPMRLWQGRRGAGRCGVAAAGVTGHGDAALAGRPPTGEEKAGAARKDATTARGVSGGEGGEMMVGCE
jgi:hypothetical protein